MESGGVICWLPVGPGLCCLDIWRSPSGQDTSLIGACQKRNCVVYELIDNDRRKVCEVSVRLNPGEKKLDDGIMYCKISLNGKFIALCYKDKVTVWDIRANTLLQTLIGHDEKVHGCTFLSDEVLLSCAGDGKVIVWDFQVGKKVAEILHETTIRSISSFVCQSHQHGRVICGGSDGKIYVWDVPADLCSMRAENEAPMNDEIDQDDPYFFEVHDMCNVRAHSSGITCVDVSCDSSFLTSSCSDGTIKIWKIRHLQQDLQTVSIQSKFLNIDETIRDQSMQYIPISEDCIKVADGGASKFDECENEFRCSLVDYKYDKSMKEVPDWPDMNDNKNLIKAAGAMMPDEVTYDLEPAFICGHEASCTDVAFASNFDSIYVDEDDAILFSCAEDCFIKVWDIESGRMLSKIRTPQQVTNIRVYVGTPDEQRGGLSRHFLYGCCEGQVVGFELIGLVELQTLAEYALSVSSSTCEAYWQYCRRPHALKRALMKLGLDFSDETRKDLASKHFDEMNQAKRLVEKHKEGLLLLHGADAESFLQTIIGRREEATHEELGSHILAKMRAHLLTSEALCKALVKTPYRYSKVLQMLAMEEHEFTRRTGGDHAKLFKELRHGGSLDLVMQLLHHEKLPPGKRNRWGGDHELGMCRLPETTSQEKNKVGPRWFFFAYMSVADQSGSTSGYGNGLSGLVGPLLKPVESEKSPVMESDEPTDIALEEEWKMSFGPAKTKSKLDLANKEEENQQQETVDVDEVKGDDDEAQQQHKQQEKPSCDVDISDGNKLPETSSRKGSSTRHLSLQISTSKTTSVGLETKLTQEGYVLNAFGSGDDAFLKSEEAGSSSEKSNRFGDKYPGKRKGELYRGTSPVSPRSPKSPSIPSSGCVYADISEQDLMTKKTFSPTSPQPLTKNTKQSTSPRKTSGTVATSRLASPTEIFLSTSPKPFKPGCAPISTKRSLVKPTSPRSPKSPLSPSIPASVDIQMQILPTSPTSPHAKNAPTSPKLKYIHSPSS